ncbi:hypothetical protein ACP4OV_023697 [Aristida adscensionis]
MSPSKLAAAAFVGKRRRAAPPQSRAAPPPITATETRGSRELRRRFRHGDGGGLVACSGHIYAANPEFASRCIEAICFLDDHPLLERPTMG